MSKRKINQVSDLGDATAFASVGDAQANAQSDAQADAHKESDLTLKTVRVTDIESIYQSAVSNWKVHDTFTSRFQIVGQNLVSIFANKIGDRAPFIANVHKEVPYALCYAPVTMSSDSVRPGVEKVHLLICHIRIKSNRKAAYDARYKELKESENLLLRAKKDMEQSAHSRVNGAGDRYRNRRCDRCNE